MQVDWYLEAIHAANKACERKSLDAQGGRRLPF